MPEPEAPSVGESEAGWRINGELRVLDLLDIDGLEWRDAKAASGMSQAQLLSDAFVVPIEFEAVAAVLWVWERRETPELTYDQVLGSLSYKSLGIDVPPELGFLLNQDGDTADQ